MGLEVSYCNGCTKELSEMDIIMGWSVCMDCTKARHGAVLRGNRCHCGKKRRETEEKKMASRRWISCHRCLGVVLHIS